MRALLASALILAACGFGPSVSCAGKEGCGEVVAAAQALLDEESGRPPVSLSVFPVTTDGSHWQVIACFSDRGYRLIDVTQTDQGTPDATFGPGVYGVAPCG